MMFTKAFILTCLVSTNIILGAVSTTAPMQEQKSKILISRGNGMLEEFSAFTKVVSTIRHAAHPIRARNQSGTTKQRIICYYTNWAQYRPGQGKYTPSSIKEGASLCTHIHYAFAKIENDELKPFEWNDADHDGHEGNYRLVTDLKKSSPDLKVLLSVGGWNMNSHPFSQMVRTPQSRKKFINSAKTLLLKYNFDGLDYDWEYPTQRDAQVPGDKHRFTLLLKETTESFKNESKKGGRATNEPLLVSVALAAGQKIVNVSYEWAEIHKYLDYAVLMSYDFHGSWDNVTGENSPLFNAPDDPGMSVNASATLWANFGFARDKLALGVASYGRSFTLKYTTQTSLGAPVMGPGTAQQFTRLAGMASYYELCQIIKQGGVVTRLQTQHVPYVVRGNQWTGYDDEKSFQDKINFAKKQNFGGVALWTLDLDDFSGQFCGTGTYPMLKALATSV